MSPSTQSWNVDDSGDYKIDSGSPSFSHASSSEVANTVIAFHGWKYKHYFVLVSEDAKNIRVRFSLCVGNKMLLSAKNTTSNLKKHLNSVHKNAALVECKNLKEETKK